jgi:hypothetical protein
MTFVFPSVLVSDSPAVPGWWSSPYSEISVSVTRDNLPIKTENIFDYNELGLYKTVISDYSIRMIELKNGLLAAGSWDLKIKFLTEK